MAFDLATKQDLQDLKQQLLSELKQLLTPAQQKQKKWLKSWEVIEMLGISRGTLQNMRINGTLKATPVGGLMFYDYDDIVNLMKGDKKSLKRT